MPEPSIKARIKIDTADLQRQLNTVGLGGGGGVGGGGLGRRGGARGGGGLGAIGGIGAGAGLALAGPIGIGVAAGLAAVGITKAAVSKLTQASPRLQGSLNLLKKSFEILLRPIAEVIDLFVRPFAIQMIRFAIPAYKLWREKFLPVFEEIRDALHDLATLFGLADTAKNIAKDLPNFITDWVKNTFAPAVIETWERLKMYWSDTFLPFVQNSWTSLKDFVSRIIEGDLVGAWEVAKEWWSDIFVPFVIDSWEGLKDWWEDVFTPAAKKTWTSLFNFIGEKLPEDLQKNWTNAGNVIESIPGFVKQAWLNWETFYGNLMVNLRHLWADFRTFISTEVVAPIREAWSNLVNSVKAKIGDILTFILSFGGRFGNKQHGGLIERTGLFKLEAGEFVFRPGQVKGGKPEGMGGTINFSPTINVVATINSEIDIQRLAEQLGELQHEELRRRVSFMNDIF